MIVQRYPPAFDSLCCIMRGWQEVASIQELHKMKEDRKTQIVPGTEIMVDAGDHHFVKSAGDRVLVPQPSSDPHDPLVRVPWPSVHLRSSKYNPLT